MTEINERLALLCGLHRNEPNGGTWWDKDGHTVDILFTESLDAQAKYLWPLLQYVELRTGVRGYASCMVRLDNESAYYGSGKTPALASAQAIYKLLEGKADGA